MTDLEKRDLEKKKFSLTELVRLLNSAKREDGSRMFHRRNGMDITSSDVQGYIRRGHLPKHLGNWSITPLQLNDTVIGSPLYRLKEEL